MYISVWWCMVVWYVMVEEVWYGMLWWRVGGIMRERVPCEQEADPSVPLSSWWHICIETPHGGGGTPKCPCCLHHSYSPDHHTIRSYPQQTILRPYHTILHSTPYKTIPYHIMWCQCAICATGRPCLPFPLTIHLALLLECLLLLH